MKTWITFLFHAAMLALFIYQMGKALQRFIMDPKVSLGSN
jgi:hypothetical protein